MPVAIKTIKSTKKATLGQPVDIRDYWYDSTMEPLAVAYGCFSPFTGKYGHARLLEAAKKRGIKKFVILSPNKKQPLDDDRNMFTLQQKVEIAAAGAEDLGYNIQDAFIAQSNFILSAMLEVADRFPENRIVLICGPDRADEYGKFMLPYNKNRKEQLPDDSSDKPGQFEIITVEDRGEKNVSGTKVRETIRNNDKQAFLDMTGYSVSMWNLVRHMAIKNKVVSEAMAATARVGIKHLYNPGNPQQLDAIDFLSVLDWFKEQKGKLVNGKNYSMTEKSDGTAFRMGLDDEGEFFIEQSYSGPVYDPSYFKDKYEQKFGKVNRLARGWMNLLADLKNDSKTQKCLNKIFDEVGAFKILGEAFINELGLKKDGLIQFVGSKYEENKIGKKDTIVMFDIVDGEGKSISGAQTKIKYLIKNASSADIKYDDAEINYDANMNLATVVNKISKNIDELNKECLENYDKDIETILTNKSRQRADLAVKKEVKGHIEEQQGILNSAIEKQLEKYQGKWGPDYEGVVIKLSNGTMLKITSKSFKAFKAAHDTSVEDYIMGESYVYDAIKYIRG